MRVHASASLGRLPVALSNVPAAAAHRTAASTRQETGRRPRCQTWPPGRVQRSSPGTACRVPENHVPVTGVAGFWDGPPGDSGWHSHKAAVRAVTNGACINFRRAFPDFSPWAEAILRFGPRDLCGQARDARLADLRLAAVHGLSQGKRIRRRRQQLSLVWHHCEDARTMMLLPMDLHNNVPHSGGACILRRHRAMRTPFGSSLEHLATAP